MAIVAFCKSCQTSYIHDLDYGLCVSTLIHGAKKQRHRFNQLVIGKEISCCFGMGANILYSSCSLLGQVHKDESLVVISPIGEFMKRQMVLLAFSHVLKVLSWVFEPNAMHATYSSDVSFMLPHVVSLVS